MIRTLLMSVAVSAFLTTLPLPADPIDASPAVQEITSLIQSVRTLKPDEYRMAAVSGLTIQRDVGQFQFERGTFALCTPVGGRVIAAVFTGTGSFRMRPSTEVEQAQLRRFYGADEMNTSFKSLVIFFADATERDLKARLTFGPGEPDDADDALEDALDVVVDEETKSVSPQLLRPLLNGETNEFFLACLETKEHGPLYFGIDPYDPEEVFLARRSKGRPGADGIETICLFHQQDDYLGELDVDGVGRQVSIASYRLDVAIDRSLDLRARAVMAIAPMVKDIRWFSLSMAPELRVDSVVWASGRGDHWQATKSSTTWLRVPDGALAAPTEFTVYYHGGIIYRYQDWLLLYRTNAWYPRHDFADRATFEMTFRHPTSLTLLSAGQRLAPQPGDDVDDDVAVSRWRITRPGRFASFNIGYFYKVSAGGDTLPPVTVYRHQTESRGTSDQIAWDVAQSLSYYSKLFGPPPFSEYHVSSYPTGHGEAFPGLIHLSSATFGGYRSVGGFQELFRSHEVAHQWWGLGVDPASYHDWWLGEAFSEYSGMMYMHAVLKDAGKFFGTLARYREEILGIRRSLFSKGQEPGPIWLGQRLSTSTTEEDYGVVIYHKGAWVLHMLRMMLIDPNTLDDRKFVAMLREFYTAHQDRVASTEDFQRVAEKHMGSRLDWFFQQWVFGSAVPRVRWSWQRAAAADGSPVVRLRLALDEVPKGFRVVPLVRVTSDDGRSVIVRRTFSAGGADVELPLPFEPKKVEVNVLESVLGEFEEVEWE